MSERPFWHWPDTPEVEQVVQVKQIPIPPKTIAAVHHADALTVNYNAAMLAAFKAVTWTRNIVLFAAMEFAVIVVETVALFLKK